MTDLSSNLLDSPQDKEIPNATAVLVLGIISIPTCLCYGIIGLVCGIVALSLAVKAFKEYNLNPGLYKPSSYANLKAGRVCAIIGMCLSALFLLYVIVVFAVWGFAAATIFEGLKGMKY